MGCGTSHNAAASNYGNTIQVAPAPPASAMRHTSLDSVHVSNSESSSSRSKSHVRSSSRPASNEASQQLSRPISRISARPSGGDNTLNTSQGSSSLSAKLAAQSRPHSHVSRSYSRVSRRPTTRIDQWDNSTPGDTLELSGYHSNTPQLSTCAHCDHMFTTAGLRVPLLLLCGHTYCTNCIDKACASYPSAIKCGQCHVNTPVDQQGAAHMMQNEALLEVLHNKQLQQSLLPLQQRGRESCAECERQPASLYCSNCSAAFCAPCSHKSHAGSKVRGKHTPVPITQRPQPNPTCKRHPGQTCMLYCETERVPMCVLCKFYGQHRYHKYELLTKVAGKQSSLLADKQQTLQRLERHLGNISKQLSTAADDITARAHQSQRILEGHFSELRGQLLTLLERREAVLLSQLDQQVELKQEMLQEQREEVAIALSKVIACQEEVTKLQGLSPVTSLLASTHLEQVFTTITMDTYHVPHQITNQSEVPLSLVPDVTPQVIQLLQQHGAILQLPSCPTFNVVMVTSNSINLQWSLSDTEDVTMDTTLQYSLEYHAKLPSTLTRYDSSRKSHMASLESGFDDASTNSSSDYKSSQWGSTPHKGSRDPEIPELSNETHHSLDNKDVISSLLPAPLHLRNKAGELPAIVTTATKPSKQDSSSILNLPPLKSSATAIPPVDHVSNSTSGVFAESEDSVPMATREHGETPSSDNSNISTHVNNYINIGRHSNGIQFEEIYHGNGTEYNYTSTINGASYYFRLRCHNAAGWGPYSDIMKCTVND